MGYQMKFYKIYEKTILLQLASIYLQILITQLFLKLKIISKSMEQGFTK
jgi:hypothetical protein